MNAADSRGDPIGCDNGEVICDRDKSRFRRMKGRNIRCEYRQLSSLGCDMGVYLQGVYLTRGSFVQWPQARTGAAPGVCLPETLSGPLRHSSLPLLPLGPHGDRAEAPSPTGLYPHTWSSFLPYAPPPNTHAPSQPFCCVLKTHHYLANVPALLWVPVLHFAALSVP